MDHSYPGLCERNLHFPAWEYFVVQVSNRFETVLDRVEFHQRHVFLVWIAQNLHSFHLTELAEYFVESVLPADVLFEGAHVEGLGGRVDGKRSVRGEPECFDVYLS